MKRSCFKSLLPLLFVLLLAGLTSCHKDNEPEIKPVLDSQLIGSWQSEIKFDAASLSVVITFKEDGKVSIVTDGRLSLDEEMRHVNAEGTWTAENGVLYMEITQSDAPELIGKKYEGKYKILVGQLYFQDLFLFPFDKIK